MIYFVHPTDELSEQRVKNAVGLFVMSHYYPGRGGGGGGGGEGVPRCCFMHATETVIVHFLITVVPSCVKTSLGAKVLKLIFICKILHEDSF